MVCAYKIIAIVLLFIYAIPMNICTFSVLRPVSTIVMMAMIILAGVVSFFKLPVREYPNIETPTVSISTTYTGAAPSVIEAKVTQIIENSVAGIDGISTINSTSKEGKSTVRIEFTANKDLSSAVNDVRDKVSRSVNKLPPEADSPIIAKFDSDATPIMILAVTSNKMSRMEVTDYINRYLLDKFSIVDGVAEASIVGGREKSIRIWLKKNAMAARRITVTDVENALKRENIDYPSGRIESKHKEYPVIIERKYNNVNDFKNLVISKNKSGDFIKLIDIADIEVSSKQQRNNFACDNSPTVGVAISKQSNSNTVQIAEDIAALIESIKTTLPDGMHVKIVRDDSKFIKSSIQEVYETLGWAALLVFVIIFAFIGTVRATIIPFITVPISIIGAFCIIYAFGYSINMLTLLAMVLAIGTVVDDSIVVLENIYRRIEEGEKPFDAAIAGAKQVITAVISTTIVLLAVFLPICVWSGKTGRLFSEFAVTISAAIAFSSFVSLTLTPMLCAKMLNNNISDNPVIIFMQRAIKRFTAFYEIILHLTFKYKQATIALFIGITAITSGIWYSLHNEYEPIEDRSTILVKMRAEEGTGFNKMSEYADKAQQIIVKASDGVRHVLAVVPDLSSNGSNGTVNSGQLMIELAGYKNRPSAMDLATQYRKLLKKIIGIKSSIILPTGIATKGSTPVQFVVAGREYEELQRWRDIIFEKCKNYKGLVDLDCDYRENTPQFIVDIDTKRAAEMNLSIKEIGTMLETMLGSKQVTSYIEGGREYNVILQAISDDRNELTDIKDLYIKNNSGALVNLDNVLSISEKGAPSKLIRHNRNRAITISAGVGSGYSLDQALKYLDQVVKQYLPPYANVFYKGQSRDLNDSKGGIYLVFLLAIIVSYLALSSQFESFITPIIIMMSVPLGALGAVLGLKVMGYSLNIYNQIALLMLMGLSAKQGILIVEFANQLINEGMSVSKAAIEAAKIRFRPIIMTCLSTVAGAIPLTLANGASSASRKNIGLVEVFGCISGVIFISILIPLLFQAVMKKNANSES